MIKGTIKDYTITTLEDQIEKVAKVLKNTLEKSLSPGVYQILDNLLNQVDADSTNPLYIDII